MSMTRADLISSLGIKIVEVALCKFIIIGIKFLSPWSLKAEMEAAATTLDESIASMAGQYAQRDDICDVCVKYGRECWDLKLRVRELYALEMWRFWRPPADTMSIPLLEARFREEIAIGTEPGSKSVCKTMEEVPKKEFYR
ncbi:hypothetical protein BDZ89DRAFT_1048621 [Hymenopellis radicata]|nr:hypothetical protein BDZ89DRAFT_1048621 [Hymenopellis radicata]